MNDLIDRQAAIDALNEQIEQCDKALNSFDISLKDEYAVKVERASLVAFRETLEYLPPTKTKMGEKLQLPPANCSEFPNNSDTISRKWLMECVDEGWIKFDTEKDKNIYVHLVRDIAPSAQPERKWTPCSNPPKHHKDVIVRGIEAIGNVTVHKVMQWDVDTWRPTDYAPSIMWKEWSEI